MQLAIELPDKLGQELMQRPNVQQFVQRAIEKMLLEEQVTIPSVTKSLVGVMENSGVNENDYKRHLEEKHR